MTADELTVAGRRFRTRKDYEAALRDEEKIKHIKTEKDLNNPKQLYELFSELKSGTYRFETIVGTDFDDEIYEKVEDLKKRGITPQNAGQFCSAGKKKKLSEKKKIKKENGEKNSKKVPDKKAGIADDAKLRRQILNELQKREKRRKLIVVLASLVAVLCFGYFGVYYFFSARTSMDYETLASLKGSDVLSTAPGKNEVSLHKTGFQLPDVLDEYKTLYEKNKKLIGWLKIDDTIIDYPVMQCDNNTYYLNHNFDQEEDKTGTLFLDCGCDVIRGSDNYIIYGHHVTSGKMFSRLSDYESERYYQDHPYITFDTIYEEATYQVMYAFRSRIYNEDEVVFKYYQFINAYSEEEFNSYMQEMAELAYYDTGVTAVYGDQLLTLSTCDYQETNGRFVVVAKRIR